MTQRSWRLTVAVLGVALLGLTGGALAADLDPAPAPAAPPAAAVPVPVPVAPAESDSAGAVSLDPTPPTPIADPTGIAGLNDAEARRVRREGLVVRPFNLQAPSFYALKARDSGRIINFLVTTRAEPLNWREFRGKVVIVSGREYLDRRPLWKGIPLLNVDTIEAVR